MQSHRRKVYACLAVTCHLHIWQNDRDLLRATATGLTYLSVREQWRRKAIITKVEFLNSVYSDLDSVFKIKHWEQVKFSGRAPDS